MNVAMLDYLLEGGAPVYRKGTGIFHLRWVDPEAGGWEMRKQSVPKFVEGAHPCGSHF